jgi:sugar phosphate isomerase/epimerase
VTANLDDINWVLWAGTTGLEGSLDERVEAATASQCTRVSLGMPDIVRAHREGIPASELGRRIRDRGVDLILDPVMNWHGGAPSPTSRFGLFTAEESLQAAEEVGAVSMTLIGNPTTDGSIDDVAQAFARACDRTGDHGAAIHLEFMPMTVIRDLETAWTIVSAADRANGGILFDTWHFFRGNPDWEMLRAIDGARIFAVQIDDAHAQPQSDARADTLNRLLPGRGEFDLVRAVAELDAIGALTWVGPEVMSAELEAMDARDAAILATGLVRDLIATVRAS